MLKVKNALSAILEKGNGITSDFSMEAVRSGRGITLTVSGVISICELTDTEVSLKSHKAALSVIGKRLVLTVFENKTVEIVGAIKDLEFSYGKV